MIGLLSLIRKFLPDSGYLGLLNGLLDLANGIADHIRERNLMQAGEAVAVAKSVAEMGKRLKITDQITAEIEAMTDEDLDAAWEKEP